MNIWFRRLVQIPTIARDVALNTTTSGRHDLFYVIENADWSIAWDGKYIVRELNNARLLRSRTIVDHIGIKNKIIHFGSENTFINKSGFRRVHPSNKVVLTWFHISPGDERVKYIPRLCQAVGLVHTSCSITKRELIEHGLDERKIVVVPLGVDLRVFKKISEDARNALRKELEIPEGKIIIGSFQKDGEGWEEGLKPKLIKGPDVFCDTVEKVNKKLPVHVLLTGPARGYVMGRLKKANISYTHKFLADYQEIGRYYSALDVYLVASRAEGGPKAILESMASGVPVVSSMVGMAPDIISSGFNGILAAVGDVEGLAAGILEIASDQRRSKKMAEAGIELARKFSWDIIARRYYDEIYSRLN